MTLDQLIVTLLLLAGAASLVWAMVRADDFEEARREGWWKRGQGRE